MVGVKAGAFLLLLVAVASASELSSFLESIGELEEQGRKMADLFTAESEVKDMTASREELEDDKDQPAGSASQEKDDDKSDEKPDDGKDSDEDDDDSLELIPVRGLTGFFGLHNLFSNSKPWWTGPNVCVEKDEKEEKSEDSIGDGFISFGTAHFSNCINAPDRYTCKNIVKKNGVTKTTIVTYQCCHGFRRTPNSSNCTKVETKPVMELIPELGGDKFADMAKSVGVEKELDGKVTIFLPTDEALENHNRNMDSMNSVDPVLTNEVPMSSSQPKNLKSFVLGHIVDGVHTVSDLSDEEVLITKDNTTLRINFLPGRGGVTVNCARLNATDKLTQEGVVHLVDGVLEPARETLAQKLSDERFSRFRQLLEDNDLWDIMSDDKPLTVFAVENEAAEKISSKHNMCMRNILSHHILPHTLCSAMGDSGERLATLDISRSWLPFTGQDGTLIIGNGTKITSADNIATNGIMHVAEQFVIPSGGRTVSELLNKTEHGAWLEILEKSGLLDEIESTPNMTMFVPTNEAVEAAKLGDLSQAEIQDVVRYHVGKAQAGNVVSTLLPEKNLTITAERSMFPGLLSGGNHMAVQCALLTRIGGRVCNGLLHELESVLTPPKDSLYQYLENNENLTILRKVLQGTKLEEELKQGLPKPVTFLAPTDSAFEEIGKENLDSLLTDKSLADEILRSHVLTEVVCCSNTVPGTWPFVTTVPTLAPGRSAEINRRGQTSIFASLPATECDHVADGGVVHLVSGVRLGRMQAPERKLILRRPHSEIILAGL